MPLMPHMAANVDFRNRVGKRVRAFFAMLVAVSATISTISEIFGCQL